MKKLLSCMIITAMVTVAVCSAVSAGTETETKGEQRTGVSSIGDGMGTTDIESWDWAKTYRADNFPVIYNTTYYYGEQYFQDGTWAEADLLINQSKDWVAFAIYVNNNYLCNNGSADVSVPVELQLDENTTYSFTATIPAGGELIELNSSDSVKYQNIIKQLQEGYALLYMDFSGSGFTCGFEIPLDTDYSKILSAMSGLWYIPTYDDTICTGSGVDPDLETFVYNLSLKIDEAIAYLSQLGMAVNADNFLSVKDSVTGLSDMYDQYEQIKETVTREADIEYINNFEEVLAETLIKVGASTAGDALSEALDENGHPYWAGIVDIITDEDTGILDGIMDWLSE